MAGGGAGVGHAPHISNPGTTSAESLTTPILSLATPNMFSSLPPLFSSIMGDFPFGQPPGGASAGGATGMGPGGGGGGGEGSSAALVAFPVSIQPSASGGGMGNLVLQAQNMGQPFLLTPTYDRSSHPLLNTQGPPSSLAGGGGVNPSMKDLEQLKQQYERTTQLIQQQLLLSQMTSMMHHQHQQQTRQDQSQRDGGTIGDPEGTTVGGGTSQVDIEGGGGGGGGTQGVSGSNVSSSPAPIVVGDRDSGLGSQETDADVQAANQYINGSDVMIGSRSQSDSLLRRTREVGDLDSEDLTSKRPRLDTSVSAL